MSFKCLTNRLSKEIPRDPSKENTSEPPSKDSLSGASKQLDPPSRPCTGATYTIFATVNGYGNLSYVDELPHQLTNMHLKHYPRTPGRDVTAIHQGFRNDHVFTANQEARLLKVVVTVREGSWSPVAKRHLAENTYNLLCRWKGKKVEKTDIVVQIEEIRDWETVLRNGRWGMWDGAIPTTIKGESDSKDGCKGKDVAESVAGMSIADSERTLVA